MTVSPTADPAAPCRLRVLGPALGVGGRQFREGPDLRRRPLALRSVDDSSCDHVAVLGKEAQVVVREHRRHLDSTVVVMCQAEARLRHSTAVPLFSLFPPGRGGSVLPVGLLYAWLLLGCCLHWVRSVDLRPPLADT